MEEYSICSCKNHIYFGSEYPKDKVPKNLFYKDPNDFKSKIFKHVQIAESPIMNI